MTQRPEAGKDWRQEEKGTTEEEIVGWHHQDDGRVWASSKSWWCTGRPGMLQSLGLQSWTWLSDWTKWTDVWEDTGICAVWNYSLGMHLNRARIQSTECLLFLSIQKSLGLGLGALQWLMTPPLQNCCGGKHSLPAPIPYRYSYKRYFPTKILCLSYSWE